MAFNVSFTKNCTLYVVVLIYFNVANKHTKMIQATEIIVHHVNITHNETKKTGLAVLFGCAGFVRPKSHAQKLTYNPSNELEKKRISCMVVERLVVVSQISNQVGYKECQECKVQSEPKLSTLVCT
jgi:hypothetical protein